MPKRDSPSENALTIISTSRELSPKARQMLAEGSKRGSGELQTFFEGTYFQSEYNKLPVEEAEAISGDLHNVLDILKPLLEILEESRSRGVYPPYSRALRIVLAEAYDKLSSWRCFEGWGMHIEIGKIPLSLLPLPKTDAAIRQCPEFIGSIERGARSGMLSLVDSLYDVINRFDMLCIVGGIQPPKQGLLAFGRRSQNEERTHLSSMDFDEDIVDTQNIVFTKNGYSTGSAVHNKFRVTFQDTVFFVGGLLDDVLSYSKRVKGEHSAGQSLIHSLRTMMGQRTPRP